MIFRILTSVSSNWDWYFRVLARQRMKKRDMKASQRTLVIRVGIMSYSQQTLKRGPGACVNQFIHTGIVANMISVGWASRLILSPWPAGHLDTRLMERPDDLWRVISRDLLNA